MSELQSVDVTALAQYLDKVGQISTVSKVMGPTLLRDLIEGQDVAGALLARAIREEGKAKARLDYVRAIAYLERAAEYLKEHGIKDTSEARKMYGDVDPDVMKALDYRSMTEAMVVLLKNKLSIIRQAHDDLKKIIYGDNNGTNWDGM